MNIYDYKVKSLFIYNTFHNYVYKRKIMLYKNIYISTS